MVIVNIKKLGYSKIIKEDDIETRLHIFKENREGDDDDDDDDGANVAPAA